VFNLVFDQWPKINHHFTPKTLIMQKLSMRKLSLLGLVLMAASAVTAAVMPKDKSDKIVRANGSLTASTGACGNQVTCTATGSIDPNFICTISASATTASGLHTSVTALGGDTTSDGIDDATVSTSDADVNPNTSGSPC
jgi:hypothetical protein